MKHKFQQFVFAFLICLIGTSFHPKWGIGIALGFAFLKNIIDSFSSDDGWSWAPIASAIAGGTTGVVVYIAIDQYQILQTVTSAVERFVAGY